MPWQRQLFAKKPSKNLKNKNKSQDPVHPPVHIITFFASYDILAASRN